MGQKYIRFVKYVSEGGDYLDYKIIVGGKPDADLCHCFQFDYGSVKNIALLLEEEKLYIECRMKINKNADQFFTDKNNCFSEAIKKGMLFHLLLYSKPLSTENIRIYIDDEELNGWKEKNSSVINSLIQENLEPGLPPEWKDANAVFQYFCNHPKSKQKDLAASLFALLYSKTKKSETERFLYLWMSMNGLYNHLAKLAPPRYIDKKKKHIDYSEAHKIQVLATVENWGTKIISSSEQGKLASIIKNAYRKNGFIVPEFYEELRENTKNLAAREGGLCDFTLDGYLNLCYPYYLRCNLFHADKPLALFALKHEFEIECMCFINKRLETYLDHNLFLYFDENYCKEQIMRSFADA